jgi:hypothetical protein
MGDFVLRTILSVIVGVVVWVVVVTAINFAMRHFWPAYAAVEKAMAFDVPMMAARLSESAVSLILAAAIAARIAPNSRIAPWVLGLVLLAVFIPIHIGIWSKFPIWYHVTFLASLVVIPVVMGSLGRGKSAPIGN